MLKATEHVLEITFVLKKRRRRRKVSSPVDVVFSVSRQVVVDDKGDLLNINASGLRGEHGTLTKIFTFKHVMCHA